MGADMNDELEPGRVAALCDLLLGLTGERLVSKALRMDVEEVARSALVRTRNRRQWHDASMPLTVFSPVRRMEVRL